MPDLAGQPEIGVTPETPKPCLPGKTVPRSRPRATNRSKRTAPCQTTPHYLIESDVEIDTESQQNTSFSSAQRSAIEEIVSRSVHTALNAFSTPASALSPLASNQTPCTPDMASPLGLSRPVDRNLEDKILRGEYVDFALLGTLSNDNGDGDGNATASGETQKFHCA